MDQTHAIFSQSAGCSGESQAYLLIVDQVFAPIFPESVRKFGFEQFRRVHINSVL